jgi:hypothetical protein
MVHFQEKGQTVTSAGCSDRLVKELKPAIRSKRREHLSKRVLLLHDIPRPTAAHTVDTLRAPKFEVLKHPPYSPDLAASDFYLFGPMKEHLRGQKFADDDEVMEAVRSWLKAMLKRFFLEGIRKLVDRWTNCVAKQGDCAKNKTNNFYNYSCKKVIIKLLLFNDSPTYRVVNVNRRKKICRNNRRYCNNTVHILVLISCNKSPPCFIQYRSLSGRQLWDSNWCFGFVNVYCVYAICSTQ